MRYLIVGNGPAGTTAAEHIRANDPRGEITVITEERLPFYSRIRLVDYLAGEAAEEELVLKAPRWYEENGIALSLGTRAASLDTARKALSTSSGEPYAYDKLLLATGGRSFVPPIEGAGKKGVFTLKTIEDARALREYSRDAEDVAIIGGGVLGLEIGNALLKAGKRVSVVEFFPRLLPRQVDEEGSRILCSGLEEMGFAFHLGARTREIAGGERAEAVVLDDGRRIGAGMVVISAGIRPDASLAEAAGIECGSKGIAVGDRMETSAPGVFAAGDSAEHRGVSYGIWPAAQEQGRVAGINMSGGEARFEGMTPSNVLRVAGMEVASAGDIDPGGAYPFLVKKDEGRHIYLKLVHNDGSLRGCIVVGTRKHRGEIIRAVSEGRPPEEVGGILEEI